MQYLIVTLAPTASIPPGNRPRIVEAPIPRLYSCSYPYSYSCSCSYSCSAKRYSYLVCREASVRQQFTAKSEAHRLPCKPCGFELEYRPVARVRARLKAQNRMPKLKLYMSRLRYGGRSRRESNMDEKLRTQPSVQIRTIGDFNSPVRQ